MLTTAIETVTATVTAVAARGRTGLVSRAALALASLALGACASGGGDDDGVGPGRDDAATTDGRAGDGPALDGATLDAPALDARPIDAPVDAAIDARPPIITGGPCASGLPGAAAYRIRWTNGGGTAIVQYEVNGLPDQSRDHAGAFGYQIGFTPQFVDVPLGGGGLLLNSSSFVDLELSTVGLASITSAQLALYGRSYSTGSSGSFGWQTFDDVGQTAASSMSNAAPYRWYAGDMTTALSPGDDGVLIRIKAGPASGSLAVARIELCVSAT